MSTPVVVNRRRASRAVATRAMSMYRNQIRGTPSHPNVNFGKLVMGGVQKMENNFQKQRQNMEMNEKVKVMTERVKRRVSSLFNHYGIKNASNIRILMPKVSKFVVKNAINMSNTNNTNNEAGVRRLIYKINRVVPARFLTTKQSRFKEWASRSGNNNQTRTPPSINNIINKRMQLIYKYYRITPPTSNPILRNFVLSDWRESGGNVSNNAAFNRLKKKIKKISPPALYAPRQFNYIDFINKLQPKRPQTPPVAAPPGPDPFKHRAARIGRHAGPNSVMAAVKAFLRV